MLLSDLVDRLATAGARRAQVMEAAGETWEPAAALDRALAVLRADHLGSPGSPPPSRPSTADALTEVAEVFSLDETDTALLAIAAAADLDRNVGIAYGALAGDGGIVRPSVGLATELAGLVSTTAEAFDRLGPQGPLRRHRLVQVEGSEPWPARTLRVPDPVVAVLAGARPTEPIVTAMRAALVPLKLPGADDVTAGIEHGVPLVWVHSPPGSTGPALAAGAVASLGLGWVAVDLRRQRTGSDAAETVAACVRHAALLGRALIVLGADALDDGVVGSAMDVLAGAPVPVVTVAQRPWNPTWLAHYPLVVEAEPLGASDRAGLWDDQLGAAVDDDAELHQTLLGLRLSPEAVGETVRYARLLAETQGRSLSGPTVLQSARRIGGSGGPASGRIDVSTAAGGGPGFGDLALPADVLASLHELVSWGRRRNQVSAHGPLRGRGRGITALFTGKPGTGKTLAAHVVAEELSVDLFQIQLSAVVDKYIGETEKNLEKAFQAAEALDVVLFFDEADALFGKRSEVHDARDRYANQEIAYLLQRMEHFEGISILATNLRGNVDSAFARRLSFVVDFPDPDPPTRRRLWEQHLAQLPALDGDDPVRIDELADVVELTGGDIRNIVLAAAYCAADAGDAVGMRTVATALVREYRKLGLIIPDRVLGWLPAADQTGAAAGSTSGAASTSSGGRSA